MHYRFFHIRAIDPAPGTAELNAFIQANPVTSVERQFVADGQNSYWSVCVIVSEPAAAGGKSRKKGTVDYREVLSPEHFATYARLRTLRNRLAEEQGTPPYAIFTNEQLAEMAQLETPDRSAIEHIEGIGEKRLALYADTFLALLRGEDG
jgi:superfamily II DNA helicase RecQ